MTHAAGVTVPQLPDPRLVVNSSRVGAVAPQLQVPRVTQPEHALLQTMPAPHVPCWQGGSHTSFPSTTPFPHMGGGIVVVVVVVVLVVGLGQVAADCGLHVST